jgi:anti-sigma B factor antagonist
MNIFSTGLDQNPRLVSLVGKLDILGVGEIETKLAGYCSGDNVHVLVDLSQVEYIASIGIRLLLISAKSIAIRGGKIGLLNPGTEVKYVLELSGLQTIMPIFSDLQTAQDYMNG